MNQLFISRDPQLHADLSDLLELLSIALTNPNREIAVALVDGSYFADLNACLNGIESLIDEHSLSIVHAQLADCAETFPAQDSDTLYHAINQEFTRLFIAPRCEQMPLYESLIVHRGDKKASMFINPTCMHCEQEYRKHGFPFPEKGKTPGDHIAIELRYLAFLISSRIHALAAQNEPELAAVDALILDFTTAHIKRWLHSFADELEHTAMHPFYQTVAKTCLCIEPFLLNVANH